MKNPVAAAAEVEATSLYENLVPSKNQSASINRSYFSALSVKRVVYRC